MNLFLIFTVIYLLLIDYKVIKIQNQSNARAGYRYDRRNGIESEMFRERRPGWASVRA